MQIPVRGNFGEVIAALGIFGVVLAAGPAAAPGPLVPVRIELDAPVGCADPQAFSDALTERSASIRFAKPGEAATLLRVRLTRTGNQVRGELSVIDAEGATDTRRVDGASCEDVLRGLSLTASLALDRLLPAHGESSTSDAHGDASAEAGSKPNGDAAASAPSKPTPVPEPAKPNPEHGADEPKAPPEPPVPLHVELGVELIATELVAPKWNTGAGATFALRHGSDGPSLGVALLYSSNDLLSHSPDLVVHWVGASLSACPTRFRLAGRASLEGCGLFSAGRLSVSDREALRGRSVARSWWSAGGLVRAGVELAPRAGAALELGLSLPLVERRFVLENPEQSVGKSPAVSTFLGVGVRYQL